MFGFEWTRERLSKFRAVLWIAVGATLIALLFFWAALEGPFKTAEPVFKIVGYVIGPLFALIGFFTSQLDKIEINEQRQELGRVEAEANSARKAAEAAKDEADKRQATAAKLFRELEGVTKGADKLWNLRPAREFAGYRGWYHGPGAKVVSICNLKGGVGKTTLAANYAAYVSETLHKRVLVVDLDYQGSLSNMLLLAIGRDDITTSPVDSLFQPDADLRTLQQAKVQLVPKNDQYSTSMSRGWLVPCGLTFARLENQLLLDWLIDQSNTIDVRYRLAHALLDPAVRNDYDLIIFDLPPRMTLGAINALVTSHNFFVPTLLDGLSVEAIPQMLQTVGNLKKDLGIGVEFSGVIGTMTTADVRSRKENESFQRAAELAAGAWPSNGVAPKEHPVLERSVPKRVAFADAAGNDVAILKTTDAGLKAIMHTLFEDMSKRIGLI